MTASPYGGREAQIPARPFPANYLPHRLYRSGRLGLRLTKTWNAGEAAKSRLITAWLRGNVWHELLGKTKTRISAFDGSHAALFATPLGGTWGEIGAGVSGQLTEQVSLFATGAYNRSLDDRGREGWDGRLGINMKW